MKSHTSINTSWSLLLAFVVAAFPLSVALPAAPVAAPFVKLIDINGITTRGQFVEAKDAANVPYLANVNANLEPREADALAFDFDAPAADRYYIWAYVWVQGDESDSFFVKVGPGQSTWVIETPPTPDAKPYVKANWPDWLVWNHLGGRTHQQWLWWRVAGTTNPRIHPQPVPLCFQLSAGKTHILIAGREPNARIGKVLITNDTNFAPEGLTGLPQK